MARNRRRARHKAGIIVPPAFACEAFAVDFYVGVSSTSPLRRGNNLLPDAIGHTHDARIDHEDPAHEHQLFGGARHGGLHMHRLAKFYAIDELQRQRHRDGCKRLRLVTRGEAKRSVDKRHQRAALQHAVAILMLVEHWKTQARLPVLQTVEKGTGRFDEPRVAEQAPAIGHQRMLGGVF